jgi:hypothetical protein
MNIMYIDFKDHYKDFEPKKGKKINLKARWNTWVQNAYEWKKIPSLDNKPKAKDESIKELNSYYGIYRTHDRNHDTAYPDWASRYPRKTSKEEMIVLVEKYGKS